jgi:hypothetical protein
MAPDYVKEGRADYFVVGVCTAGGKEFSDWTVQEASGRKQAFVDFPLYTC